MRITILGSCSGTEPMPERHHTSWFLETGANGDLFWFDAGENCAHRAHTQGADLLKTRAVFISHPHMDHTGGMPHLLWTIDKLSKRQNRTDILDIDIWTPVPEQVRCIQGMLDCSCEPERRFHLHVHQTADGLLCAEPFRTTARHNRHIDRQKTVERWHSFSFRIECEGKVIVYSGDIFAIDELDDWTRQCDLFLMETGHHDPVAVCRHLIARNSVVGRLVFLHHGRAMLNDAAGLMQSCSKIVPFPVEAACDGMSFTL